MIYKVIANQIEELQAKNFFMYSLHCFSLICCTFFSANRTFIVMSNETNLNTMTNTTLAGNHSNDSREELIDILSTFQKISLAVPYFIIEPLALVLNFLTLYIHGNVRSKLAYWTLPHMANQTWSALSSGPIIFSATWYFQICWHVSLLFLFMLWRYIAWSSEDLANIAPYQST